ncbi:MbtH family protein [Plantactinospora endophytica]|uniref:Protein mbtH n=1 Tax=Plantactinospora endophytica TaxID=673535 RepID=A0ABQ4DZY0_9ACTN|nr:MbtH family protein [Plantactinospora endophytica]GIG88025.1 protein mbtH [Plantactinospora endophytica]
MSNPFDDDEARFHVLVNDEGQYSLWPAALAEPAGWSAVLRDERRAECLAHVEAVWQDMRPRSLVAATGQQDGPGAAE